MAGEEMLVVIGKLTLKSLFLHMQHSPPLLASSGGAQHNMAIFDFTDIDWACVLLTQSPLIPGTAIELMVRLRHFVDLHLQPMLPVLEKAITRGRGLPHQHQAYMSRHI